MTFGLYVRIKAGRDSATSHAYVSSYHGVVLQGNWRHYYGEDLEDGHAMVPLGITGHQTGERKFTRMAVKGPRIVCSTSC